MVRKATDAGLYSGFKVPEEVNYSLLQFADDTIIVGDGSWSNLWKIKALVRGFKMASGLRINFTKSKIYGVGCESFILEAAAAFLGCKTSIFPFKFLGFLVGGNHRRTRFWRSVLEKMKDKLGSWRGMLLSIGGRVTLLNNVLSNLPSFSLSFYKAPIKVINEIRKIQRQFLWNGVGDRRGISWVKWDSICRSKDKGGLGVKDVATFNQALLSKWIW
ncbi:uncharacterized protein LOC131635874 [Vicia villosa]|uniref:uncharacterized protein LOC131635874 n=1 Tax=Vicia villosa TaxID=3911 RepID=UPI00273ACDFB|nr:uncharacterized protein LOC131635874 [Vicia villosa]